MTWQPRRQLALHLSLPRLEHEGVREYVIWINALQACVTCTQSSSLERVCHLDVHRDRLEGERVNTTCEGAMLPMYA